MLRSFFVLFFITCLTGAMLFVNHFNQKFVAVPLGDKISKSIVISDYEGIVSHTFQIDNKSSEIIKINHQQASCSCTKLKLEERKINPHGSVDMYVEARVRRPDKPVEKVVSINLETSSSQSPHAQYLIRIYNYPQISLNSNFIDAGSYQRAVFFDVPVTLETYSMGSSFCDGKPFLVGDNSSAFRLTTQGDASFEHVNNVIKKTTWKLRLKGNSGEFLGEQNARLRIGINGAKQDAVPLAITWLTELPITVNPKRVFFGNLGKLSEVDSRKFSLNSVDGAPFFVRNISTNHEAVTCNEIQNLVSEQTKNKREFLVNVDPSKVTQNKFFAKISIEVQSSNTNTVMVSVIGYRLAG